MTRDGLPSPIGQATEKRIRELCAQRGYSFRQLGRICGIRQSTLDNLLRGMNRCANLDTVDKICDGLGMTIQEFFDTDEFRNLPPE